MARTRTKLAIAALLTLGIVLLLVGCDQSSTSTTTATVTATQQDAAPAAEPAPPEPPCGPPPGEPPGGGPPPCSADADCTNACPSGSAGCACFAGRGGRQVCLSTCAADSDCPRGAGVPPLVCREGACRPSRPPGPPLPPPCVGDADCANGCPAGADGCTCRALPNDGPRVCMMKCRAATDCQAPPGAPPDAPPAACQDGVCVPPPPPDGAPPMGPPPLPPTQ